MDDDTLLAACETATLPAADWHHRQHLKVAYLYLSPQAKREFVAPDLAPLPRSVRV